MSEISVIREVLTYRGVKIRPWMLKINAILQGFISFVFLSGIAFLAYCNLERLIDMDKLLLVFLGSLLLLVPFLTRFLHRYFEERFLFYKKWIRLYIMARFLKDHSFYIEKEKKTEKGVKRKIVFPKVYVKQKSYELFISLELQGNKFQEQFLNLGSEFETAFFMDFMDKVDGEKFVVYQLAYAAFLNRIHASEVTYDPKKGIKLAKNLWWNFVESPHLLVAGGTGGGKTTFIRAVLIALLKIGVVDACDPKRADFVPLENLEVLKGRIHYDTEKIVSCFENGVEIMHNRMATMRKLAAEWGEKELGSFDKYGLEPYFILCDEFNSLVASMESGNYVLRERFMAADKQLILQGRQAGVFLIKLMQKPSAQDLPTIIRDNMMFHISIGKLSDTGYPMMFGDENKNKRFKNYTRLAGKRVYRGYAAVVGELAQEYYSPLVTKDFNFYDVYEAYPRIANPFNPLEKNKEGLPSLPVEAMAQQTSLADFAKENDLPLSTARKIMELLVENGYEVESSAGAALSDQVQNLLVQIMADKELTNDTYKVVVKRIVDRQEELASGAVQ